MSDWLKKTRQRIKDEDETLVRERQKLSKSSSPKTVKKEEPRVETKPTLATKPAQKTTKVQRDANSRRTTSDKRVTLAPLAERKVNNKLNERVVDTAKGTGKQFIGGQASNVGTMMSATDNLPIGIRKKGVDKNTGTLKDIIDAAGVENPGQKVTAWADKKIESGQQDIEKAKEGLNGVGRFAVDAASQGALIIGDAIVSRIVPGLGQISFASRASGMGAYEARQAGATEGQQAIYGAATGLMELGLERMFSAGKYLKGTYGKGVLDDIVEPTAYKVATSNLLKGITKTPQGQELMYQLTKAGFAAGEEGIEEALADLISPLLQRAVYSDEIDMPTFKQVGYDFLLGAVTGGMFGAAGVASDYKSGVGRMNQVQEAQEKGQDMTTEMIGKASVQAEGTEAQQYAQRLQERQAEGKPVLGSQLNDLQRMTAQAQVKSEVELRQQKERADIERMAGDVSGFKRTGSYTETEKNIEVASEMNKAKSIEVEKIVAENDDLSVALSGDSATFEAVARVTTGTATANDIDKILMKPAAKALVKEVTGVTLPVENTAARKSLETLVAITGAESRMEAAKEARVRIAKDFSKNLGDGGSKLFVEQYQNVDGEDADKYTMIFNRFYQAGETAMPIQAATELVEGMGSAYQAVVDKYFPAHIQASIHKAGFADSRVETAKNEERVIRHGNINQKAKKGRFRDDSDAGKLKPAMKKALTALAERTGVNIVYVNKLEFKDKNGKVRESNGQYEVSTGTIYLSANSSNPLITVAKHELTHHLKIYAPKEYQALEDYVFSEIYKNDQKTYDAAIREKMREYGGTANNFTRFDAREELLADMAEEFFTSESAIEKAIAYSKSMGEAILDGIKTILDTFMVIADADDIHHSNEYGKILKELDILENAERLWMKALQASLKNDVVGTNGKTMRSVKGSAVDSEGRKLSPAQQKYFAKSKVRDAQGRLMVLYHGSDDETFYTFDRNYGMNGFFLVDNKKTASSYSYYQKPMHSVYANLKNPLIVDCKGLGYSILHPNKVSHNGNDAEFEKVLNYRKYYDDLRTDDWTYVAEETGRDGVIFKNLVDAGYFMEDIPGSAEPSTVVVAFNSNQIKSVANENPTENPDIRYSLKDSEGTELSKKQQEFFKDSVARDAEGRLLVLYHGSRSMAFTEFDLWEGAWLTPVQSYAEIYAEQWHSWRDDYEDTATERDDINGLEPEIYNDPDYRIYKMYANIEKPLDLGEIDGPFSEGFVRNIAKKMGVRFSEVNELAKHYYEEYTYMFTRSSEFIEFAKEHGYDGFTATESGKQTFCVFDAPNQVKLTTNQNPTENPDIRYSLKEMDNEYMTAVKSGDMSKAQRLVDKAAKMAGYTEKVFHGTKAKFNTFRAGWGQYGPGVYFTYDEWAAEGYGEKKELYVKIGKIADYDDVYKVLGKTEDQTFDEFAQTFGYEDWDELSNDSVNDPTNIEENPEIINALIDEGFEGFEDDGNAGFVLWDIEGYANRIKSADAVVYDDSGNIIPLSERFNSSNPDIRYSMKDSEGNKLSKAQQEYFAESKIRDEDGNLRVVYHGSAENFTVFDRTKGRANMDIQGMFFSPWEDDAMGYGENVQAYYLNIKNPAPESVGYKALRKFQGQNNAGVKAREYLESLGYDGVNNGDEEYIAFHSNQIKLVSNQNPTKNDDVRYSLKEMDNEYMSAVNAGNMAKAQKMVDAAAKKAGFKIKAYHGTMAGRFNVFRTDTIDNNMGSHFGSKDIADRFADADDIGMGRGNESHIYSVYLKANKPFDTYDWFGQDDFYPAAVAKELADEIGTPESDAIIERIKRISPEIEEIVDDPSLVEEGYLESDDDREILYGGLRKLLDLAGYDAIRYENGLEIVGDINYIIQHPNQIKIADPVTYDDSGNIIPLSERFNSSNPDIRYSMKEEDWLDDDEILLEYEEELLKGFAFPSVQDIMDTLKENIRAAEEAEKPKPRYREKTKEKGLEAKLTNERIEALFEKYGASTPTYAQAYITAIHPRDFLSLTLPDSELEAWDGYVREGGHKAFYALDLETLKAQPQTPFLEIDEKTSRVTGHEGRHRMRALLDAGVTSVPIAVVDYSTKYTKKYKKYQELRAQQWDLDDGPINDDAHATVLDLVPINKANEDLIKSWYGGEGDIKFSIKEEVTITESDTVAKHSLKSWNNTDKEMILNNLIKAGYSKKAAEKWINDVNGVAAFIAKSTYLDYDADEDQDMLKNNAEYVKTLDASTLCKKRLLYQGVYNAIQHRLPNTALEPEDVVRIRQIMDEAGLEVPCGICYEESRKKNEGKFAKKWLAQYKGEYIPRLDEVTTTDGRAKLKKTHPEALESYLKYQKTRGSANPKVTLTRTDYRGDILNLTASEINAIKHLGGLRVQSFSDFEIPHLIDMMQAVLDMAEMGLTSQAYTKVPAFAKVFGNTGIKINLSLIGQVDETGKLVFDAKEGINPDEAFALREQFSDNVGTIIVGANKESILAAWADDRIDMVIPFHRSGWKLSELEDLGLTGYRDFTRYQSERYMDGSKNGLALSKVKKKHGFEMEELYSIDYWDPNKTGKENAEIYLKLCAEQKRRPVFYNFLVDNGDGSYSLQPDGSTDGYWKSLVDFKMYNNEGEYAPQRLVTPTFEMDAAYEVMEAYDENPNELPVDNDIVEQFVAEYKEAHPRAKYQLKEGPSVDRKVKTLEDRVAHLKSEMKRTKLRTPVEKDTKVQASRLIKRYDSNLVLQGKLVDTMKDIFNIYKSDGDWYAAYDKAEDMARRIVDKVSILHDESWQEYKELREYLRKTPVAVADDVKKNFSDYENFRKRNMGRIKLTNAQGVSVNDYYQSLAEKWPEKFTDDYTEPVDQLQHIEDVLDSLAPWYEHYSSRQMQGLVTEIAEDIMVTTGELATRKTFADRKAEEKENAVAKAKRERNAAMERMKEKYEDKLIRQKKVSKEKMDAYKEKQKDRASRKKAMDRLQKSFNWLSERLLTPSDTKHIPESYRAAVAELLDSFDFSTDRTEANEAKNGKPSQKTIKLRAFKDRFRQIMDSDDGSAIELDPDFLAFMDEITDTVDGYRLTDLDTVTLDNVSRMLKQIQHQMSYIDRCFNDDIKEAIHDLGEATIWEANETKNAKEYTGLRMQIDNLLNKLNVTPADMFELVGGAQKKLYQGMRNGFDRHVQNVQMAIEFTQNAVDPKQAKKWSEETHTFELESGKVEMTTTQIMSLYALIQREQAQTHILGSGITMAPVEVKEHFARKRKMKETKVMPTLEEVLRMVGTLTDEQRQVADHMRGFLSNECAEWGNRTSMKLYGYKKFTEKDYFPIKSTDTYLNDDFSGKRGDATLKNMGFTKALQKGANNPIVIDDFFTVFTDHVNKMSMYEALVPAMTDFNRVYNYKKKSEGNSVDSVQDAIMRAYGRKTLNYIDRFMEDLNGAQRTRNDAEIATSLISTYKKASIGGNLRVLLQQPTAIVRAFAVINPKYFTNLPAGKATIREMQEHCSIAQWKSYGFYNTDVARDMKTIMLGESNVIDDVFMGTYGKADDWTWANIWKAVKKEVETEHPELKKGSDEYWQKVNERASYVYDRTQVVDSVFHRSQIMRNKGTFEKMATSFMAEPTKTYNLLRTEILTAKRELQAGKKADATKRTARVLGTYVLNAMTVSMAAAIADAMRGMGGDDDEDKGNFRQRWWAHSISNLKDNANPLTMIPYIKDVVSMYSGYDIERMDMQGISKLLDVQSMWEGVLDGSSKYTPYHAMRKTAETISYFTGLPVKNIFRDIEGAAKCVAEAFGNGTAAKYLTAKWTYNPAVSKYVFADLYYDALAEGDSALAGEIKKYMKSNGIDDSYIKRRKKTWEEHNKK